MAFTPRTFSEILADMIAYVRDYTSVSDFTVGSVVRTILEAAALEDDEQYFQMVQLLNAFSYTDASGEELDARLADFGLSREPAKAAFGFVRFKNTDLKADQLAQDEAVGSTSLRLFTTEDFPTSGFPYTVRVGEGTVRLQDVLVTAHDTVTNTLTLSGSTPLLNDFEVGDVVGLVTGSTSQLVNTETEVKAPRTSSSLERTYKTQEPATIVAGNLYSNEVLIKATSLGVSGNVGAGRISKFSGAPPFTGAQVVNDSAISGGTNSESDVDFRDRAVQQLQSLSRGTVLALKTAAIGVEAPTTGQRVVSANILEDFVEDEVIVYIDDGSGFTPDLTSLPVTSLAAALSGGEGQISLADAGDFPSSGYLFIPNDGTNDGELVAYESVSGNIVTVDGTVSGAHDSAAFVLFVQVITASAETGRRRFSLRNIPVVRSTDRLFIKEPLASDWTEQVRGVDYEIDRGTGEIIFVAEAGLEAGTQLIAAYSYYTKLVAEVQKVLEGDEDDSTNYPGVKAAGVFLSVEAPTLRRITVRLTISAEQGYVESDLVDDVARSVEAYITSRKIGQDIIRARIIDACYDVTGVRDVTVSAPTANITILEDELPVPFDNDGNSLVTVL